MKETILVYRDPVHDADIRRDDLSGIAWQNNWEIYDIQKKGDHNPFLMIWVTQDEKTAIHYLENHLIDVPYIFIRGEKQDKISEILSSSLDFYSIDELDVIINSKSVEEKQLIRAIHLFGTALTGSFDTNYFKTFEFCLSHPNPEVRKTAMFAAAAPGWSEFRPTLEYIRDHDSDLEVKNYASTTLESMQIHHWTKQLT